MSAEKLLADLAAVWVDRWLKYGGSLIVDAECNNVQIGMGETGWRRAADSAAWQRHWHDGWQVGRWRELSELCGVVPGLRAAIIHHVALHGERKPWGAVHMVAAQIVTP